MNMFGDINPNEIVTEPHVYLWWHRILFGSEYILL